MKIVSWVKGGCRIPFMDGDISIFPIIGIVAAYSAFFIGALWSFKRLWGIL